MELVTRDEKRWWWMKKKRVAGERKKKGEREKEGSGVAVPAKPVATRQRRETRPNPKRTIVRDFFFLPFLLSEPVRSKKNLNFWVGKFKFKNQKGWEQAAIGNCLAGCDACDAGLALARDTTTTTTTISTFMFNYYFIE